MTFLSSKQQKWSLKWQKSVQLEGISSVWKISLLKSSLLALPSDCPCPARLASDLPSSAFSPLSLDHKFANPRGSTQVNTPLNSRLISFIERPAPSRLMQSAMHGKHCVYLWLCLAPFPTCLPSIAFDYNKRELIMTNNYGGLRSDGIQYTEIITTVDSYIKGMAWRMRARM